MDSLILVLVVVGAVMVLAGFARMKSRKRETWDDIDHSVLFSKDGEQPVADDTHDLKEPGFETAPETVSSIVDEPPAAPVAESVAAKEGDKKKASLFDKIKQGINKVDDEEDEPVMGPSRPYKPDAPDLVVVLNVTAPEGRCFKGSSLVQAVEGAGMRFGEMDIYHYYMNDAIAFSLANMVKPGTFNPDEIEEMTTPGVSLFVQLPVINVDGIDAFNAMLEVTHALAQRMGGELRDETRSVLTHSVIDGIRERIIGYNAKWRVMEKVAAG